MVIIKGKMHFFLISTLVLLPASSAADKVRIPIALEGHVYDNERKPIKGVLITVSEGSYTTQGETSVIPVIMPNIAGAVVINDPNVTKVHYYNTHYTKTNNSGYYSFITLSPGGYKLSARGIKKEHGHIRTTEDTLGPNKKLLVKYKFPPAEQIIIRGGQTSVKDFVLFPTKLVTEVCSVPEAPQPEDSRFVKTLAEQASKGSKEAMRLLGYAYQDQRGIRPDSSQAACWFRRAASRGDLEAERELRKLSQTVYD